MSSPPRVSIIIVSWNGRDLLARCLASLAHHVRTPYECIVVDNSSTDGTPDFIAKRFPTVRLIRNTTNRGFSAANNQGAGLATGQVLFFLNADTEAINDPLPALLVELEREATIGAVGPRLLNSDRSAQYSVRRFPRWSDQVVTLLKLRHVLRQTRVMSRYRNDSVHQATAAIAVDEVMGAAVMLRRRTFKELGGWDEGYWIWFEDVDLCQRLNRLHKKVLYAPTAQIIHHGGSSFGRVLNLKKQLWFMASLWRYARKYWSPVAAFSLWPIFFMSYLLTIVQTAIKPR